MGRRTNCESVVILCLRILNVAIESLSPPDIQRLHWPSTSGRNLFGALAGGGGGGGETMDDDRTGSVDGGGNAFLLIDMAAFP